MFKDRSTKKFFKVLLYVLLYFVGRSQYHARDQ